MPQRRYVSSSSFPLVSGTHLITKKKETHSNNSVEPYAHPSPRSASTGNGLRPISRAGIPRRRAAALLHLQASGTPRGRSRPEKAHPWCQQLDRVICHIEREVVSGFQGFLEQNLAFDPWPCGGTQHWGTRPGHKKRGLRRFSPPQPSCSLRQRRSSCNRRSCRSPRTRGTSPRAASGPRRSCTMGHRRPGPGISPSDPPRN